VLNAILGAQLGVFYYGRVIERLDLWPSTKHQYPLYDSLAMGVQMMVFTYILGRTDPVGRTHIEVWADSKSKSRLRSSFLSIAAVIGHVVYLSVFAPHFATKLLHLQTVGPTGQLFEGRAEPAALASAGLRDGCPRAAGTRAGVSLAPPQAARARGSEVDPADSSGRRNTSIAFGLRCHQAGVRPAIGSAGRSEFQCDQALLVEGEWRMR
jgi:hypothetical protein